MPWHIAPMAEAVKHIFRSNDGRSIVGQPLGPPKPFTAAGCMDPTAPPLGARRIHVARYTLRSLVQQEPYHRSTRLLALREQRGSSFTAAGRMRYPVDTEGFAAEHSEFVEHALPARGFGVNLPFLH